MAALSERQVRFILGGVGVGSFALLMTLEIVSEQGDLSLLELLQEAVSLLLIIASAVGVALLVQRMNAQHEESMALMRQLEIARDEGESWRSKVQSALAGIRDEMDKQFLRWGMTVAERDVGLLILKGLNHKEIATLRGTSEATVRQQAQSIYRKSRMPGKTAFCAYFLEDLFAPEMMNGNSGTDHSDEWVKRGGPGPRAGLNA